MGVAVNPAQPGHPGAVGPQQHRAAGDQLRVTQALHGHSLLEAVVLQVRLGLRPGVLAVPLGEDVLELPDASPENKALEQDLKRRLLEAVRAMPPLDKEIFLRYYYEYQTMEQIAAAMEIPIGTIKSRLSRGRRKLRQVILEQEAEG